MISTRHRVAGAVAGRQPAHRGLSKPHAANRRTRFYFCGAFAITVILLIQPLRAVVVVGHSMEPELHPGQVLVETKYWEPLHYGDIVVVRVGSQTLIKRVAYLPGQYVAEAGSGSDWFLMPPQWRKRAKLAPLTRILARTHSPLHVRAYVVPAHYVFVVGDNRAVSVDSRQFGPVAFCDIRGKIVLVKQPKRVRHDPNYWTW